MFNIFHYKLKKIFCYNLLFLLLIGCKKEVSLSFSEEIITSETDAIIEIVYPKANGDKLVSNAINTTIETHISNTLNFDADKESVAFNQAIKTFNNNFKTFKNEFPDSSQKWEALIDGEVIYQSPEVISLALNTYIDTGGAHGNGQITLFNFNPETGLEYKNKAIIKNSEAFLELARSHFKAELNDDANKSIEDYFWGDDFKLPENIGFSHDGIILLYNTYEIASYSQGITEFTIPYEEANKYLKIN